MKYFTKKLMDAQQGDPESSSVKEAEKEWDVALKEYNEYLVSIKPSLSKNVQKFSELCLHDAVFKSIETDNEDILVKLDCGETDEEFDSLVLKFKGVKDSEGVNNDALEQWWLYEELSLLENGKVELKVLCDHSEIRIVAEEIDIDNKSGRIN